MVNESLHTELILSKGDLFVKGKGNESLSKDGRNVDWIA